MKSYRKELWFHTPSRVAFINTTPHVNECLKESGVREGLALVNARHITASVFINHDESGFHHDYTVWLEKLAPYEPIRQYRHNDTGKDSADAHMKRQVMGRDVVVAITDGNLTRIFHKLTAALACLLILQENYPQSAVITDTPLPQKFPCKTNILRDHHTNL